MPKRLRRIETIVRRDAAVVGGKARHLAALARAGLPVPEAYVVPAGVGREFLCAHLSEEDLPEAWLSADAAGWDHAHLDRVAAVVSEAALPEALRAELRDCFVRLTRGAIPSVAVRSSSTVEDGDEASAAGLHQTFLHVASVEALEVAVRSCWASVFRARVLSYLQHHGYCGPASMGVIIQCMVPAEISGVLFTANPMTGDHGEIVINAAYGLGSSVVDGAVSPDTMRIDKASELPRDCVVGEKATRLVLGDAGEVVREPVPAELRGRLAVPAPYLAELLGVARRVEDRFGEPRDLEWAVYAGRLYILQGRPITTGLGVMPKGSGRRRPSGMSRSKLVWSNINVGEALPGPATPMTWSVASSFSDLGFRRAFGALGCTVPKDAELVGNFRGRIYLNLSEFTSILSQVPGLRPRALLALGGGGEAEALEEGMERRSSLSFLVRLPVTAARFVRENYRITERATAFERSFSAEYGRLKGLDLRILSLSALARTLKDRERLLDEAGAIMLTCYGNLLSSVVLLRGVLSWLSDGDAERLQRDLLSGLADVDSAAPGISLWHIAEMVRGEPDALDVLVNADLERLGVSDFPPGPTRRALDNFLQAYGHRGAREAELMEPRWDEGPALIFATLKLHVTRDQPGPTPIDTERRLRRARSRAEDEIVRKVPPPARTALRHLLSLVHRFTRLRERLRDTVVKVLYLFREVAVEASLRLERSDPSYAADAAFFLSVDELKAVMIGDLPRGAALVARRRTAYERNLAMPDPPDTFVGYPPPFAAPPPDGDELFGLAASAGRAEGRARVLKRSRDAVHFRAGEILVVGSADVGWSPLFLAAKAVVTDLGGPLSHAAVILREYGVPAVVNVKVGTRCIATGDLIAVDGDRGRVEVLERVASSDVSDRTGAGVSDDGAN